MHTIISAKPLDGYFLEVEFDDGSVFAFDVEPFISGQVFEPLRDLNVFRTVKVDHEIGSIVWPTGADFCPDFLYMMKSDKSLAKAGAGRG